MNVRTIQSEGSHTHPFYKYHLLPSVKAYLIDLFGEDICGFGEDSHC